MASFNIAEVDIHSQDIVIKGWRQDICFLDHCSANCRRTVPVANTSENNLSSMGKASMSTIWTTLPSELVDLVLDCLVDLHDLDTLVEIDTCPLLDEDSKITFLKDVPTINHLMTIHNYPIRSRILRRTLGRIMWHCFHPALFDLAVRSLELFYPGLFQQLSTMRFKLYPDWKGDEMYDNLYGMVYIVQSLDTYKKLSRLELSFDSPYPSDGLALTNVTCGGDDSSLRESVRLIYLMSAVKTLGLATIKLHNLSESQSATAYWESQVTKSAMTIVDSATMAPSRARAALQGRPRVSSLEF